jgi:hypothetical protein
MKALIVILLVQFMSQSLLYISTSQHTFGFPLFLKEQEERDQEETLFKSFGWIAHIDFSDHSHFHTTSQSIKLKGNRIVAQSAQQSELQVLYCTFVI